MKKLLILIIIFLGNDLKSQNNVDLNAYKYIVLQDPGPNHRKDVIRNVYKELKDNKNAPIFVYTIPPFNTHNETPKDLKDNPGLGLYIHVNAGYVTGGLIASELALRDYAGNNLFYMKGRNSMLSLKNSLAIIWDNLFYKKHAYEPSIINSKPTTNSVLDFSSEIKIRDYFDSNNNELIEGIWQYTSSDANNYKIAIVKEKDDIKYTGYIIESSVPNWKIGDTKATFESAAVETVVTIKWNMADKVTNVQSVGTVENGALIKFSMPAPSQSGDVMLYKVYPKLNTSVISKTNSNNEWAGNGSGIIISGSGYIITNNHVIEDANKIEVEFIENGDVKKYNTEIVKVDKINDLAILKIFDMSWDGIDEPPYNFKLRSSDVGTKVYAYGYPMALSIMGKEIKITDGIISSKSGFDGDITTYQITAPIQGGNSGGPLFDDKGNLIGINSSGIRKDLVDNVGYSIKSSYLMNLIDVLPQNIELPSNNKLENKPLTEQIKEISKYVVLIKVK